MRKPLLSLAVALSVTACAPPYSDAGKTTEAASGASAVVAAAPVLPADPNDLAALKARLAKNLPGVPVETVRATPMPGVYEVQSGMNFGYVSLDGRFLIEGDLNDLASGQRLTEDRRREARATLVNNVPMDQSIEFTSATVPAKYTITVFTDIDCGYCRKLHSHIADYNADGIAVRYLFFPRSGPDTDSFYKAEKVWCSADRRAALTQAKLGGPIEGDKSCANPVMSHLQLAAQLGLRGTPAIVLPDGELIPGYQTPDDLLKLLVAHEAGKKVAAAPG